MTNMGDSSDAFSKMLEEHRQNYLEDLPDKLDDLEQLIQQFDKTESPIELSQEIFRDVHSLKGSAGTFGLPVITSICHQLEEHISEFSDHYADTCLPYVELMREAVDIAGSDNPVFAELETRLYKYQKKITANKLLVASIDSSRLNNSIIAQILEQYPVKVTVMTDGLSALSRLLFVKFDLIITTRELPSLSGPSLIGALQATNCANNDVSTILLTSNDRGGKDLQYCKPSSVVVRNKDLSQNLENAIESIFPHLDV